MKNENGAEIKIEKIEATPEKKSFWKRNQKKFLTFAEVLAGTLVGFVVGRVTAGDKLDWKPIEDLDKEPDVGAPFEE